MPEANWDWLAETDKPSQVWYAITPENSLLLTWQNALLNRDTDTPLSFQIEFKLDGRFIYRYDLSRLNVDTVTNILAGGIIRRKRMDYECAPDERHLYGILPAFGGGCLQSRSGQ